MQFDLAQKLLIWLIPLILAITLHEVAHGWMACLNGDKTAQRLGRLSINPLRHIDVLGTLLLPLALLLISGGKFAFGWAKPVPVDWRNLRSPRLGMALVALSGPLANILMALLWAAVMKFAAQSSTSSPWLSFILIHMGLTGVMINLVFAILNLLPIPPLDGSRLLSSLLSHRAAMRYNSLERYGFIILVVLLLTNLLNQLIFPPVQLLVSLIFRLLGLN